jgi:hypothetical protein
MLEFYEPGAAIIEDSIAKAVTRSTKANKSALEFVSGAQAAIVEEIIFTNHEIFDRIQTETHLFDEFVSKMAGTHSVNGLKTMYEDCGQHQIDFIRRDCERLFKHGNRMIEVTAKLFSNQPQS